MAKRRKESLNFKIMKSKIRFFSAMSEEEIKTKFIDLNAMAGLLFHSLSIIID